MTVAARVLPLVYPHGLVKSFPHQAGHYEYDKRGDVLERFEFKQSPELAFAESISPRRGDAPHQRHPREQARPNP